MNNPVAFIPARGGSKSIPRKNIKELGGKPLIVWSIETALAAGLRTIVNTDDSDIARIAREYGAEVMEMTQEEAKERRIHQDDSSMYELLKSEIPRIDPVPDLVLLLQPTTPFRNVKDIKDAIDAFRLSFNKYGISEIDSLITVERVPEKFNPAQIIIDTPRTGPRMANGAPVSQRITRRQNFPDAFVPTGSVYLFRTKNLEQGSIYGERVRLFETEGTININSEADFLEAELWLQQK